MASVFLRSTNGQTITYANGLSIGPVPLLVDSSNADYASAVADANIEVMTNTAEAKQLIRISQVTMLSQLELNGQAVSDANPLPSKLSGSSVPDTEPVPVKPVQSGIMQPVDVQSHMQTTIQSFNAVSVGGGGSSTESTWHDLNGYDQVSATLLSDSVTSSSSLTIMWSNDGSTTHGVEFIIPSGTGATRCGSLVVKARYAKLSVGNGDASSHTMSAWLYPQA